MCYAACLLLLWLIVLDCCILAFVRCRSSCVVALHCKLLLAIDCCCRRRCVLAVAVDVCGRCLLLLFVVMWCSSLRVGLLSVVCSLMFVVSGNVS